MKLLTTLLIVLITILMVLPLKARSTEAEAHNEFHNDVFERFDINNLSNQDIIKYYSIINGVDMNITLAIVKCESEFIETAQNPVSSAGGLWQFLDGTWIWVSEERGVDYTLEDKFDPIKSTENAMWLIKNGGFEHWVCYNKLG